MAHFRRPIDMIFHGWSMSLFQASQHKATISSYDLKMRLLSQFSRMIDDMIIRKMASNTPLDARCS